MNPMPAISLAAVPGKRKPILELAVTIENAGFSGIYCPSFGDNLALCEALALLTRTIHFGTSITPIYTRNVHDFAHQTAFINEVADGRFRFGIGVSHAPAMARLGVKQGHPLSDIRQFVVDLKAVSRAGEQPPIVLAALRKKMIGLAAEIGNGLVFANGARTHMRHSLSVLPDATLADDSFFIGNMIPTIVSDDKAAAMATHRRTLSGYVTLPNYRNYWKEAGYEEEMTAIERALAAGEKDQLASLMSDRWLTDITLFGSASEIREGVESWFDAGIRTPILVPSSVSGGQIAAVQELLQVFS